MRVEHFFPHDKESQTLSRRTVVGSLPHQTARRLVFGKAECSLKHSRLSVRAISEDVSMGMAGVAK